MKYLNKFLLMSAVAVAGLFSACTDSDYEPGASADGMQIYFPNTIPSQYDIPDTQSSVTVPVRRINTDEAAQVAILANEESGLFTIPSSVSFQAGSAEADLVITFDRSSLVEGTSYPISLLLTDQENTTPYGNYMVDFAIVPWPWEEMGTGKFRDDWFAPMWQSGGNPEIDVTIHKHRTQEGVYMIEEMFGWPYLTEFFGATEEAISASTVAYTPTNITIDCSNPDQVVIPRQFTGITDLDPSYGDYEIAMYQGMYGTLKDGVITFPKECMAIVYANGQGVQTSNTSGLFRIVLPGFEATDYSLTAAYGGMRVGSDNATSSLVLDFTYGADVTGISFVVTAGSLDDADAAELAAKIVDGTAENINEVEDFVVDGEEVSVETPLAMQGIYTVVAVPADKEGQLLADAVSFATFYFPGLNGGELPECDLDAVMGLVSEMMPEELEDNPDTSSLAFTLSGSNLKSIVIALLPKSTYDEAIEKGVDLGLLVEAMGADYSDLIVPYINSTGEFNNIWGNLMDDTAYTMLIEGVSLYGTSKIVAVSATTAAITYPDYTGDLAIGKYVMSYNAPTQNGGTMLLNNYFRIIPVDNEGTNFILYDFAYEVGLSWYATYDSSSHELVLSGEIYGFEGSALGQWLLLSQNATEVYAFGSFADDASDGTDPIVLGIDPQTMQPVSLKTYLEVDIATVSGGQVVDPGVIAIYDPDGTTFRKDDGSATQSSVSAVNPNRGLVPFSSVSRLNRTVASVAAQPNLVKSANMSSSHGPRTLDVTFKKCEPMPKQFTGIQRNPAVVGQK